MARSNPFVRPILIALFSYLLTLGGTFNGLTDPALGLTSLLILAGLLAGLLILHLLRGWRWPRTPLDAAFALWIAAILISLVANFGDWRRIVIGVWYTGIYILLWYGLHDLLANRAVRKALLVDALLVSSVYLIAIGYFQLYTAAANGWRYASFFGLPRPVSLVGNTNSYASFLVLMIGLSAGRLIGLRSRFWRVMLVIYLLLALAQLFLTYSRGGWLGAVAALLTAFAGWLWVNDLLHPARLAARWRNLGPVWRTALLAAGGVTLTAASVLGVILIRSLDEPGRSTELRTYLWDVAVQMFRQQPITGRGLYTYGKMQETLVSIPPVTPQAHAHNLPLHVLGELGLFGAAAMLLTMGLVVWYGWRNAKMLKDPNSTALGLSSTTEQGVFIAGLAVMVGYGVHLLFDTTVMMPAVAITGLIAILIVVYQPGQHLLSQHRGQPLHPQWTRVFSTVYFAAGFALLAAGFISNNSYSTYVNIVKDGLRSEDYGAAARQLDRVIQADPYLGVYWWQQGILYGLAADAAPPDSSEAQQAARSGLAAFERFIALEPQNAFAWANIAGLRRQLGDTTAALEAYRQASELAPRSWQLALLWGQAAEASGEPSQAQVAYARAISASPTAALYPAIADSPIGSTLVDSLALDGFEESVRLYLMDDLAGAAAAWEAEFDSSPTPRASVLRALIAHADGDTAAAGKWLAQARAGIYSDDTDSIQWLTFAQAVLAEDAAAFNPFPPLSPILGTKPLAMTLFRGEFQRDALSVDYLPQVGYEPHDPLLVRLVAEAPKTAARQNNQDRTSTAAP